MHKDFTVGERVYLPGEDLHGVVGSIERKVILRIRLDKKLRDNTQEVARHDYYAMHEQGVSKLSTYIFCNVSADAQEACTKTAFAVDELLAPLTREQLVSIQTQVTPVVAGESVTYLCATTVVVDEDTKE